MSAAINILAGLWSFGCIGSAILFFAWCMSEREFGMSYAAFFIGIPIAALLATDAGSASA